jgi:phosphatidylserine/phosphatidylglycerophosphate/cardiolipin synthase-like enzyme
VECLNGAKQTINLQAYSFTSSAIHKALAEAHDRVVKVRLILDKSNQGDKYGGATYAPNHGIDIAIDRKHAISHSKIILIDRQTIITGSFNFTNAAEERNEENLVIIDGKASQRSTGQ